MPLSTEDRQALLELDSVAARLRRLVDHLQQELAVRRLLRTITTKTSVELSRDQREHVLRKHLQAIQRELGEAEPERAELGELRERLAALALPDEARREAEREL